MILVHTSNWCKGRTAGHFSLVDGTSLIVFLFIFPICFIFITSPAYSVWFIRLVKCKNNTGFGGCVILFRVKYDALFLHHAHSFADCGTLLSDKIPKDPLVPNQGEIVETDHLIR